MQQPAAITESRKVLRVAVSMCMSALSSPEVIDMVSGDGTALFPLPYSSVDWLLAQKGRHGSSTSSHISLMNDKGSKAFFF